MTFEKLAPVVTDFTHLYHVADIHIRLTKRHTEYREVFQRFYDDVKKSPETSLIVVAGDVVHSKSDLSPECVQMVSDFLSSLADIRETVLIPGNHDATLSNKTRLDSLSPIVDALAHPHLYYLKETKLYGFGNILFNNMCIFDDPEKYILGKDIPDIYRNTHKHVIALFHGPVDRSVTDTGFAISNPAIMPELFDEHHIALLGDIHRRQNMQEARPEQHKPTIHYPGSLVQQNHGEPLHPHGYTIWDLATYDYTYKEVPNDYGYFTIEIHGPKILTDLTDIPKKTYLRVKCTDSISSEVKAAEALVASLTEIIETSRIRVESEKDKKAKEAEVCKDVNLGELSNVDYQANLLEEYLRTKLNVDDEQKIKTILLINRTVNTEIQHDEFARNLKWKPVRFEWDNMFAYGEGNYIDFTQMNGVYGVFGPNQSGKSSIFSAMSFCLFDKWERGFKAVVARNSQKEGFRCKFIFEIAGIRYTIEKIGEPTRTGNVKVRVNFWRERNGLTEDLTDVMRRDTNDVIREYIGTFEDFILTTFSVQHVTKNNISFIDMGNTDRKDLLVQLMGLNIYDKLHDAAHEHVKTLNNKLKPHKEKNYMAELEKAEQELMTCETDIKNSEEQAESYATQSRGLNESIVDETAKLIKLDGNVPTDLAGLEGKRTSYQTALAKSNKEITSDKEELKKRKTILDDLAEQLSEISVEDLSKAHELYMDYRKQKDKKSQELTLRRVDVQNKMDKLKKLQEYKYNPDCEYCTQNVFVKDARATEKQLKVDKVEFEKMEAELTVLVQKVADYAWVDEQYQNYTKLLNAHSKAKGSYSSLNTKILLAEKDVERVSQNLRDTESKIEIYHRNEVAVENNQKVNMSILNYKNALNKVESALNLVNKRLMNLTGNREVLKKQIDSLTATIQDMISTEEERELYTIYSTAVGCNGIPYAVIVNTVPTITREINAMLTQIADFTIEMECDEKNIIPYVNHEIKGRWPIEMTSGFERFVASVCIRMALSSVTNLPRTNFLILDEGFGALDAHNLPSMQVMFTYLKAHFDFVMVISHLDSLKDMVDSQIEVAQIGTFSKVTFE